MSKLLKVNMAFICLIMGGLLFMSTVQPALADQSLLTSQEGFSELNRALGGTPQDIRMIVVRLINVALGFLSVIFVALTIFAGFQYMTSGGNEEKTKKAVDLLKAAIIGLVIILLAWSITRYSIIILNNTTHGAVNYTWYPK